VPLARDVIVAWTGDEESGGGGIRWLLDRAPDSIAAELVLNEGGGPKLDAQGRPIYVELQTAEKTYQDFTITARGTTGHSSVPLADNAIYRLAAGLARLAAHRFPARLLPVTRAHLGARAGLESPDVAAAMREVASAEGPLPADALAVLERDPTLAATLRTTCVATMLAGGSRANALPAKASATVNCRILPDETPEDVRRELVRVLADPGLEVAVVGEFGSGEPSPLQGPGPEAIRAVIEETWPGLPIVPFMSRGATDSRFVRARGVPAYGINPIGMSDADAARAHGANERIAAAQLEPALQFLYRLVVELAGKRR
jgi:acetylornithine deacetylase/succinyl-diaminopimelate desuccinylase-like protein